MFSPYEQSTSIVSDVPELPIEEPNEPNYQFCKCGNAVLYSDSFEHTCRWCEKTICLECRGWQDKDDILQKDFHRECFEYMPILENAE